MLRSNSGAGTTELASRPREKALSGEKRRDRRTSLQTTTVRLGTALRSQSEERTCATQTRKKKGTEGGRNGHRIRSGAPKNTERLCCALPLRKRKAPHTFRAKCARKGPAVKRCGGERKKKGLWMSELVHPCLVAATRSRKERCQIKKPYPGNPHHEAVEKGPQHNTRAEPCSHFQSSGC